MTLPDGNVGTRVRGMDSVVRNRTSPYWFNWRRKIRHRNVAWILSVWMVCGALFGTVTSTHTAAADPWVIGVRCQVRCLEDFREIQSVLQREATVSHEDEESQSTTRAPLTGMTPSSNPDHLFQECTEDADCSSCLQPCWNETFEYEGCTKICQSTRSKRPCLESCQHLANTSQTSGTPVPMAGSDAECRRESGGATATGRAESVTDLSNQTVCNTNGHRVRCPAIVHLSITEVWETRGASLHWKTTVRHGHQGPDVTSHTGNHRHGPRRRSALVLYVVQMQQLVRKHPLVATDWTAVTTTLSTSCNVTNVLTMGLHYRARIVAVSSLGICSVSVESRPFGLPKGHPIPGAPHNLRYDSYNRDEGGVLGYTIFWDSPSFALAISHYLITFTRITENEVADDNTSDLSLPKPGDHDHSYRTTAHRQPYAKVSGNKNSYKIKNLMLNSTYVITIQAVAQIGERQLLGRPAVLKIHTLRLLPTRRVKTTTMMATAAEPDPCERLLTASVTSLLVHPPFYENGTLKANVTWSYHKDRRGEIDQFVVRLRPQHCPVLFDQSMKRHESQDTAKPQESSVLLDKLRFDCSYQVAVWVMSSRCLHGPETLTTFETPACHNVTIREGSTRPNCPRSAPQKVKCDVRTSSKPVKVECEWMYRLENTSTIKGFLIVAKTHIVHHNFGFNNATTNLFVNKDARHAVLTDLIPKSKYHFMVRAVGDNGSGPDGHASFFVPPLHQGTFQKAAHQTWQQNGGRASFRQTGLTAVLPPALILIVFLFCR